MNDVAAGAHTIGKRFGATTALDGVDFEVLTGEIHALVGENGAGKSTLVRILGGAVRPDEGQVTIAGRERRLTSPHDAIVNGITTIPQELHLVPALSIAENLALGDPPLRRLFGLPAFIDRARMRDEARAQLGAFDFVPDPDLPVRQLGFAEQQIVAIAKALRRRCRVLILDEPTAALENREITRLFSVLRRLKDQGTGIVYVSHRLEEIVALADRCTVLRDGRVAAVVRRGAFNSADLVAAMTGRAAAQQTIVATTPGEVLLEDVDPRPDAIALRAGEVLGLAGLLGSGTTQVLQRFFGLAPAAGAALVKGRARRLHSPRAAIEFRHWACTAVAPARSGDEPDGCRQYPAAEPWPPRWRFARPPRRAALGCRTDGPSRHPPTPAGPESLGAVRRQSAKSHSRQMARAARGCLVAR